MSLLCLIEWETFNKINHQLSKCDKTFENYLSDKRLTAKINVIQLNSKSPQIAKAILSWWHHTSDFKAIAIKSRYIGERNKIETYTHMAN